MARALAWATALATLGACSSAPKAPEAILAVKNEAAGYARLADDFLASGRYASALQYYGEALNASLSVDDVAGGVKARASLGRAYLALKRAKDAQREFSDALEDARALGDSVLVALCLSNLGELRYSAGDAAAADELFAEAEALVSAKGVAGTAAAEPVAAVVAHNRGVAAMARGDLAAAEAFVLKAAAANEKARRWAELGSNRYALASIANARGDLALALDWASKALDSDKRAENASGIGADLDALGRLSERSGDLAAAFDYRRRAFGVWLALDRVEEAKACLEALGRLAATLGKSDYETRYATLLARLREQAQGAEP